jgi:hypothetical protein
MINGQDYDCSAGRQQQAGKIKTSYALPPKDVRGNEPSNKAPTIPNAISRKKPLPWASTILLAMNPAMRPKTIQPMMDIGSLPFADFDGTSASTGKGSHPIRAQCLLLPTKRDDKRKPHREHHASFKQVFNDHAVKYHPRRTLAAPDVDGAIIIRSMRAA